MGFWIDQSGSYYEGDAQPGWTSVPQRPDAQHFWENGAWVLDPVRVHGQLGYIPVEDMLPRVFPVPPAVDAPVIAPSVSVETTGGSVTPADYLVAYSLVSDLGETTVSPTTSVSVTTGDTIALTFPQPPINVGVRLYCSEAGGTTLYTAGTVWGADGATGPTRATITTIPSTTAAQPVTSNSAVVGTPLWSWSRFSAMCASSPAVATGAPRGGRLFGSKAEIEEVAAALLVNSVLMQPEYSRLITMLSEYKVQ